MLVKFFNNKSLVDGFTTNPSLMRLAGAKNYKQYSLKILKVCKKKPISFEVFADDYKNMLDQAYKLNSLGNNVFVKIPVCNSKGKFSGKIINKLNKENIKLNITAVYNSTQTLKILKNIKLNNMFIDNNDLLFFSKKRTNLMNGGIYYFSKGIFKYLSKHGINLKKGVKWHVKKSKKANVDLIILQLSKFEIEIKECVSRIDPFVKLEIMIMSEYMLSRNIEKILSSLTTLVEKNNKFIKALQFELDKLKEILRQ